MQARISSCLFVYTIGREGECMMDHVGEVGGLFAVGLTDDVYLPGFFSIIENMHIKAGHQMELHSESDGAVIWLVWVGPIDRDAAMQAYTMASIEKGRREGYFNVD
jgi:hypothetical protein